MKIVIIICNVVFWGFLCLVMLTDGPPRGANIIWSLVFFLMPILNVAVIRVIPSATSVLKSSALVGNIVWLAVASWQIIQELPAHPKEEGLLEFVVLLALPPAAQRGGDLPRSEKIGTCSCKVRIAVGTLENSSVGWGKAREIADGTPVD